MQVHLIVGVAGRQDILRRFVRNFVEVSARVRGSVHLLCRAVVFAADSKALNASLTAVNELLAKEEGGRWCVSV